ncbi:hypothetical protein TNCT6_66930 [Streptomyces sp. 6-11-2]|nr:hypothetical protein TNCT6_66930 [Streptomyces sp. 6-11-2]
MVRALRMHRSFFPAHRGGRGRNRVGHRSGAIAPEAVAVGLRRIALRVRWPTDVVGGRRVGYGRPTAPQVVRTASRAALWFTIPQAVQGQSL